MYRVLLYALACVAAIAPLITQAQPCTKPSADCVIVGEWDMSVSLGVGERSNPIAGASDIPLVVLPQISYYGRRFFLENLDLGVTAYEDETNTLNFLATPGYDRVFFVRDDPQNYFVSFVGGAAAPITPEVETAIARSRHTTYLTGVEWLFRLGAVAGQLDALYEITGRHKGYELRGAIAVPLVQSESSLVLNTGFTWKSAELVRYYYGVDGVYRPGTAINPFIKLGYSHALSTRLTLNAFAHYEYLGDAIADSPIVSDHGVLSVFAGVVIKIF
jgi:MipA family protein